MLLININFLNDIEYENASHTQEHTLSVQKSSKLYLQKTVFLHVKNIWIV